MSPRPIHHSRLFWLGLPGLVFLLWGWWDSGRHYSEAAWFRSGSSIFAFNHRGHLGLAVTDETPAPVFTVAGFQFQREDRAPLWQGSSPLFGSTALDDRHEEARAYFFPGLYRRRWSLPYLTSPSATGSCDWLPYWELGVDWWLVVAGYASAWLSAIFAWRLRNRLRANQPRVS